jgi:hypothetical protein
MPEQYNLEINPGDKPNRDVRDGVSHLPNDVKVRKQ